MWSVKQYWKERVPSLALLSTVHLIEHFARLAEALSGPERASAKFLLRVELVEGLTHKEIALENGSEALEVASHFLLRVVVMLGCTVWLVHCLAEAHLCRSGSSFARKCARHTLPCPPI